jgi:hypothetical protein
MQPVLSKSACALTLTVAILRTRWVTWKAGTLPQNTGEGRSAASCRSRGMGSQPGCHEMASDTWLENLDSQRVHEALGFEMVDRCVNYRKRL